MRKHAAFPIVVSAEDAYPGHGKVDAVQEVSSVWSLLESFTATVTTDAPETAGTVVQKGMTVTAVPAAATMPTAQRSLRRGPLL